MGIAGNMANVLQDGSGGGGGGGSTEGTAGAPGSFDHAAPANFAALAGITASPDTAWTEGQYVALGDASHAYWDGGAWVVGDAPAATAGPLTVGEVSTVYGDGTTATLYSPHAVVVVDGTAYIGTGDGGIVAVDIETGAYSEPFGPPDFNTPSPTTHSTPWYLIHDGDALFNIERYGSYGYVRRMDLTTFVTSTPQFSGFMNPDNGGGWVLLSDGTSVFSDNSNHRFWTWPPGAAYGAAADLWWPFGDTTYTGARYAMCADDEFIYSIGFAGGQQSIYKNPITGPDHFESIVALGTDQGDSAPGLSATCLVSVGEYLYAVRTGVEVRRYSKADGTFIVVAGALATGEVDGVDGAARFTSIQSIADDLQGGLVAVEGDPGNRLRRIVEA